MALIRFLVRCMRGELLARLTTLVHISFFCIGPPSVRSFVRACKRMPTEFGSMNAQTAPSFLLVLPFHCQLERIAPSSTSPNVYKENKNSSHHLSSSSATALAGKTISVRCELDAALKMCAHAAVVSHFANRRRQMAVYKPGSPFDLSVYLPS